MLDPQLVPRSNPGQYCKWIGAACGSKVWFMRLAISVGVTINVVLYVLHEQDHAN